MTSISDNIRIVYYPIFSVNSHLIVLCEFLSDLAHSATSAIGLVVIGGAVHGGAAKDGAVVVPVRPVGGSVF